MLKLHRKVKIKTTKSTETIHPEQFHFTLIRFYFSLFFSAEKCGEKLFNIRKQRDRNRAKKEKDRKCFFVFFLFWVSQCLRAWERARMSCVWSKSDIFLVFKNRFELLLNYNTWNWNAVWIWNSSKSNAIWMYWPYSCVNKAEVARIYWYLSFLVKLLVLITRWNAKESSSTRSNILSLILNGQVDWVWETIILVY